MSYALLSSHFMSGALMVSYHLAPLYLTLIISIATLTLSSVSQSPGAPFIQNIVRGRCHHIAQSPPTPHPFQPLPTHICIDLHSLIKHVLTDSFSQLNEWIQRIIPSMWFFLPYIYFHFILFYFILFYYDWFLIQNYRDRTRARSRSRPFSHLSIYAQNRN